MHRQPGVERQRERVGQNAHQRRVTRGEREVKIGPTEFRLLHFFMTHTERVHRRTQLLDRVWGDHVFIEERTVDVHVKRLREALAPTTFWAGLLKAPVFALLIAMVGSSI